MARVIDPLVARLETSGQVALRSLAVVLRMTFSAARSILGAAPTPTLEEVR